MKGTIALGFAALGAALAVAAPAHAAYAPAGHGHAGGKIEFTYDPPEIADDGESVTWHWTLKNTGDEDVEKVVLTHKLTPKLKVSKFDKECVEKADGGIKCEYGAVAVGEENEGTLVAALPSGVSGTVQINGRVTWQTPPTATPPAVDNGAGAAKAITHDKSAGAGSEG